MSVIRTTASGVMRGRVGNTSYYYLNGQQVARQARNNSNYGDEARRTEAQQTRRALWGNLVNLYKACSLWMPKAFETKERNQSDYNKFMSVNLNGSEVYLTKDEVSQGCAVIDEYIISQGSLAPVQYLDMTGVQGKSTDILCDGVTLATATVGAISQAIIAQNAAYRDKDNIAFIIFENWADGTTYPYVATRYLELTLDVSSSDPFSGHPLANYLAISENNDALEVATYVNVTPRAVGWACIHTRQEGILKVSSQAVALQKPIIKDTYITLVAKQKAIASYGVDEQVPLEPSFSSARILSAYVNGTLATAALISFPSYTGIVTLEISVEGWNNETCYLMFGDVRYTPVETDGNKRTYIIGSNGSVRIYINGGLYGGFDVSGIETPAWLPALFKMGQYETSGYQYVGARNQQEYRGYCINYPYLMDNEYPYFGIIIDNVVVADFDSEELAYENCTSTHYSESATRVQIKASVTDASKPAYITYQGFIVAIFNYSN